MFLIDAIGLTPFLSFGPLVIEIEVVDPCSLKEGSERDGRQICLIKSNKVPGSRPKRMIY